MSDYQPISCTRYDQFEIAIMRGQCLRITWHDEQAMVHVEVVTPCDLQTRAGEEYLLADTLSGQRIELRLDKIVRAEVMVSP